MLKQGEVEGEEWKEKGEEEQDREKENTRKPEKLIEGVKISTIEGEKDDLLLRSHEVNFSVLCLLTPDCPRNQNCTGISRQGPWEMRPLNILIVKGMTCPSYGDGQATRKVPPANEKSTSEKSAMGDMVGTAWLPEEAKCSSSDDTFLKAPVVDEEHWGVRVVSHWAVWDLLGKQQRLMTHGSPRQAAGFAQLHHRRKQISKGFLSSLLEQGKALDSRRGFHDGVKGLSGHRGYELLPIPPHRRAHFSVTMEAPMLDGTTLLASDR
eukprot:bmy_01668T0